MTRFGAGALLIGLAACATKGQVRLLEGELRAMRIETARRDSARAAALVAVIGLQQRIMDSLSVGREAVRTLDVRMQSDITEIQRQLLQLQELSGLSQRRLSELKGQIDQRAEQSAAAGVPRLMPAPGDTTAPPPAAAPVASADQMYQGARGQLTRGALGTARRGFQEFIRVYPTHALVPDALNSVGESFAVESPDSAVVYYTMVAISHPRSSAAPTALYKLGRLEELRNNSAGARAYYERLVRDYPRSDLIEVVRDRLKNLRP